MRVIKRKTLIDFWTSHADAKEAVEAWYHEARKARWKSYQDIKRHYATADMVPKDRVVFDLRGNTYRLIVHIHYRTGIVFIRFIGTHAEYDRVNASRI